jgi:hypothetical protein
MSESALALTSKNRKFLQNLLDGKTVVAAYREAGYHGDDAAAYALKYRLREPLAALVAGKISLDDTLLELDHLDERELRDEALTINQKLRIIALKLQALKHKNELERKEGPKTFSAFIIDRNSQEVKVEPAIDAQVVKQD